MKQLIINADDLGLHTSVNLGIIKGYSLGGITSASIMPSGKAFDHAVGLLNDNPGLGIGVHLTLVGEKPLSEPKSIQTLVNRDGMLPRQYPQFLQRYLKRQINLYEVRREFEAQIQRVLATGIKVTHFDSHQHLHILPGIIEIVIDLAKSYKVRALRIPDESILFFGKYPMQLPRTIARSGLTMLAALARKKAKCNRIAVPDVFFGMLAGGNMHEKYLMPILDRIPLGVSEIMLHPGNDDQLLSEEYGWNYNWQAELAAVTGHNFRKKINENKIKLVSFRELEHE